MNQNFIKKILLLTSVIIVVLSIFFGLSQNQDNTDAIKGKELLIQKGCLRCHSVEGKGNSRNPLDGIGKSYNNDTLEKLIVGDESIEENIPKRSFKQRYKQLTSDELKALVEYMKSLS